MMNVNVDLFVCYCLIQTDQCAEAIKKIEGISSREDCQNSISSSRVDHLFKLMIRVIQCRHYTDAVYSELFRVLALMYENLSLSSNKSKLGDVIEKTWKHKYPQAAIDAGLYVLTRFFSF